MEYGKEERGGRELKKSDKKKRREGEGGGKDTSRRLEKGFWFVSEGQFGNKTPVIGSGLKCLGSSSLRTTINSWKRKGKRQRGGGSEGGEIGRKGKSLETRSSDGLERGIYFAYLEILFLEKLRFVQFQEKG